MAFPRVTLALAALLLALVAAAQPADAPVHMKSVDGFSLGRADAPLTMVEFSDYECAYCQQYHATAFQSLKRDYIDTGKLRYVVRDLPLPMHRMALGAARAARCAGEQGRFWDMRSALFRNAGVLDTDSLVELGASLGLDEPKLRTCVTSTRYDISIRSDMDDATAVGVHATPGFVLGKTSGQGVKGVRFAGAQPYEAYETRIKALLGSAPPEAPAPGIAPR
jgi:protein-disulfide isomerase